MKQYKLIRLNIAMGYPIEWEFERVVRDLIQNFYDSIGWRDFNRDFEMHFNSCENSRHEYELVMKTYGRPFSYEWLTHLGGSTKTDSGGNYIGMYGEGFKMCALWLRKNNMKLHMESAGWLIENCEYCERIAGNKTSMLGYKLYERKDDGWTKLTVFGVTEEQKAKVKDAMLDFFYPENPLFGRKLVQSKNYAVYTRSSMWIPGNYTWDDFGILYCNYLARGRLPNKLIILLNCDIKQWERRKRKTFHMLECLMVLNRYATMFDSFASYQLLMQMKNYWNDIPNETVDIDTGYYFICQLVRNVASDINMKKKFMRKHTNLVYLDRPGTDQNRNRIIGEAKAWAKSNPKYIKCVYVNPIFRLLGARSILKDYHQPGITESREMTQCESLACRILLTAFEAVYPYVAYDDPPDIILQDGGHHDPMQYCERDYSRKRNGRRYKMKRLIIDRKLLAEDRFKDAFLETSCSLLHIYGTDRSKGINVALTDLAAGVINQWKKLQGYESMWRELWQSFENDTVVCRKEQIC